MRYNTQHLRETDRHTPAGFESAIPALDQPQTLTLDRSATEIGYTQIFVHFVVCLMTGPQPLPKRVLHRA